MLTHSNTNCVLARHSRYYPAGLSGSSCLTRRPGCSIVFFNPLHRIQEPSYPTHAGPTVDSTITGRKPDRCIPALNNTGSCGPGSGAWHCVWLDWNISTSNPTMKPGGQTTKDRKVHTGAYWIRMVILKRGWNAYSTVKPSPTTDRTPE